MSMGNAPNNQLSGTALFAPPLPTPGVNEYPFFVIFEPVTESRVETEFTYEGKAVISVRAFRGETGGVSKALASIPIEINAVLKETAVRNGITSITYKNLTATDAYLTKKGSTDRIVIFEAEGDGRGSFPTEVDITDHIQQIMATPSDYLLNVQFGASGGQILVGPLQRF